MRGSSGDTSTPCIDVWGSNPAQAASLDRGPSRSPGRISNNWQVGRAELRVGARVSQKLPSLAAKRHPSLWDSPKPRLGLGRFCLSGVRHGHRGARDWAGRSRGIPERREPISGHGPAPSTTFVGLAYSTTQHVWPGFAARLQSVLHAVLRCQQNVHAKCSSLHFGHVLSVLPNPESDGGVRDVWLAGEPGGW